MAGLVAPVYMLSPKQERILEFKGYNKKSVIDDGEMRNMYNLASDEYPCLYQRKPRGLYDTGIPDMKKPTAMIVKDKKLAIIADGRFYYDGVLYPTLTLSDDTQMAAINTRICFFPEKMFFNVKTKQIGSLEAEVSLESVKLNVTTSTITFPTGQGFTDKFAAGDAVSITASDERLVVSAEIKALTDNSIAFPDETFIDVVAEGQTSLEIEVSDFAVKRTVPQLDFVMEANNRLWGVSNKDNTIYACKLGDPTNWAYFQNTTLDSYYAEQGTDGEWTGCAAYSTHLLFFKEDCIHKVFGSKPATFQIETAQCHALEKGSSKSIAIINETVLYKSRLGIMAYSGGVPVLISENFGTNTYTNAVAGTDGIKYFVSVLSDGVPELLVFDMEKVMWHKEDDVRAHDFAYHNGKLLFINESDGHIYEMNSENPMADEQDIEWMAELGPFDEFIEEKKVYSKLKMRLKLEEKASVHVYIQIDSGGWELLDTFDEFKDRSQLVPIVPRRCNKFSVKLTGVGRCKVESLVREYRNSTMGKDVR